MRLIQTLVVRDEADVVDAQVAYHLNAGVDFVLATDHESRDGTAEILESYVRDGYLRLIRVHGAMHESRWRTQMARLAAAEYGADWVINTDADEFWMPREGTLKEVLAAVPERFGVLSAVSRHFVPRPDDGAHFAERMTVRVSQSAAINDPTSPWRPHSKVAHRADPAIVVLFGSHAVRTSLVPLRDWYPAAVHHFPFRSVEQYERKNVRRAHGDKPLGQYVKGYQAREDGRIQDVYGALVVDAEAVERGTASGSLVVDTRVRDALRAIRAEPEGAARRSPTGLFDLPGPAGVHTGVPSPGPIGNDGLVPDGAALRDANIVRIRRRIDVLGARVGVAERAVRGGERG